jgi:hypothetical protein
MQPSSRDLNRKNFYLLKSPLPGAATSNNCFVACVNAALMSKHYLQQKSFIGLVPRTKCAGVKIIKTFLHRHGP